MASRFAGRPQRADVRHGSSHWRVRTGCGRRAAGICRAIAPQT
ncbi:hypothetical protein D8I24_3699 [Cupriavidus necator H850]|nr:hypothetical protein D8I24_3699 [Cupriavidus necator H850]